MKTITREEILRSLAANQETLRGFGVRSLALFGSCARGEDNPASDLDFVVEFEQKSFDAYMNLKVFLEDLFGRPVDLVLPNTIKPGLRSAIMQELVHVPGL